MSRPLHDLASVPSFGQDQSAATARSGDGQDVATAPLSGRLPAMTPAQAQLSRLCFDRRFVEWLRATLGAPALTTVQRPAPAGWRVEIATAQGDFALALDVADWPALQLAFALEEPATAHAVATLLLSGWGDVLAPALGSCRITGLSPHGRGAAQANAASAAGEAPGEDVHPAPCDKTAVIEGAATPVALLNASPAVLQRLADVTASSVIDLTGLARLPLRPRLHLLSRPLPTALLRSLREGDVVLAGEAPPQLLCGIGVVLRASVSIDLQESTVHVAEPPHLTDDPAEPQTDGAASGTAPAVRSLDALQLPVAFELDTARVSLAELAAMQPGYAVELDVPLSEATVRLTCHGQTLGHGQLVAIGDQLGVRITRLEFVHDAAVAH